MRGGASSHSDRILLLIAAFGLCLAAVLPYIPSLGGDFVWDDTRLIVNDHRFKEADPVSALLMTDFFGQTDEAFRYGYLRPLTSLSYYLSWKTFGPRPFPFHLSNLLMHMSVSLLVFLLALRLFPGRRLAPWLGAALFALHPVHANSVAWISGRTDILCALLMLPLLILAIPNGEKKLNSIPLLGALTAFGLSPWAKEMALGLPPALILFTIFQPKERRKRWLLIAGGSLIFSLPYLLFRFLATDVGLRETPFNLHLIFHIFWTFCATFLRYCLELLLPLKTTPYMQNPWRNSPMDPWVIGGALVLFGFSWTAWKLRKKNPAMSWLLIFFVFSFLPIANIFRITGPADMGAPMAQRFLYIPSIAWCILLGHILLRVRDALSTRPARNAMAAALALIPASFGFLSFRDASIWASDLSLFSTMVQQVPEAPLPRILLGSCLRRQGRYDEAAGQLEKALDLLPDERAGERWTVFNNLAGVRLAQADCEGAAFCLKAAALANPDNASIQHNLGLYNRACGSLSEAEKHFRRALKIQPWRRETREQLGTVLLEEGRLGEGVKELRQVLEESGPRLDVLLSIADAYGKMGRQEDALATLEDASALDPGTPAAELPLGMLLLSKGKSAEASRAFERILEGHPDNLQALHLAAVALGRQGDFEAGRSFLLHALKIDSENVDILLTLAQIEHADGHDLKAADYLKRAEEIAPDSKRLASTRRAIHAGGT